MSIKISFSAGSEGVKLEIEESNPSTKAFNLVKEHFLKLLEDIAESKTFKKKEEKRVEIR